MPTLAQFRNRGWTVEQEVGRYAVLVHPDDGRQVLHNKQTGRARPHDDGLNPSLWHLELLAVFRELVRQTIPAGAARDELLGKVAGLVNESTDTVDP